MTKDNSDNENNNDKIIYEIPDFIYDSIKDELESYKKSKKKPTQYRLDFFKNIELEKDKKSEQMRYVIKKEHMDTYKAAIMAPNIDKDFYENKKRLCDNY